jgi:hypothetical protein
MLDQQQQHSILTDVCMRACVRQKVWQQYAPLLWSDGVCAVFVQVETAWQAAHRTLQGPAHGVARCFVAMGKPGLNV